MSTGSHVLLSRPWSLKSIPR